MSAKISYALGFYWCKFEPRLQQEQYFISIVYYSFYLNKDLSAMMFQKEAILWI